MKRLLMLNQDKIMILALPFLAVIMIFLTPHDPRSNAKDRVIKRATRDVVPDIKPGTDFYTYKRINDSLEKIASWERQRLRGLQSYMHVAFIGMNELFECDTCRVPGEEYVTPKHFVFMNGFTLKRNANFRIKGNEYIIERYETHSTEFVEKSELAEEKKIDVRLSESDDDRKGLTVMIPLSNSTYQLMKVVIYILFGIIAIAAIWICIYLPVMILMNIAKGKPFLIQNIKSLKRIGWTVIGICLSISILPWLISMLLSSKIPDEIYFPFWSTLFDYRWGIFTGIAILLIARAFKRGYQLQQEQELTI